MIEYDALLVLSCGCAYGDNATSRPCRLFEANGPGARVFCVRGHGHVTIADVVSLSPVPPLEVAS